MLTACGRAFVDWSADYRLFERDRMDSHALFDPVRKAVLEELPSGAPLSVHLDDTLIRKSGRKVAGAKWLRDPLGPKFRTNFVWGQRFLQISAALPDPVVPGRARGVPLALLHCPLPDKPPKDADAERKREYRVARDSARPSALGVRRLAELRRRVDEDDRERDAPPRTIVVSGDGGFTNKTTLGEIPERTVFIGRIRKDAALFEPPPPRPDSPGAGRPALYGPALPTPEEIRKDDARPWRTVEAFAAGREHEFRLKTLGPVRWRPAGGRDLQLVVVAPLGYRLRAGSKVLYREPAFLVCTDPELDAETLLRNYLWRWQIEVNWRDEKTVFGMGQAQVRSVRAVRNVPALIAAAYATLMLAAHRVHPVAADSPLPVPAWQRPKPDDRLSPAKALALLRSELWGAAISDFSGFASRRPPRAEPADIRRALPQALFLASP